MILHDAGQEAVATSEICVDWRRGASFSSLVHCMHNFVSVLLEAGEAGFGAVAVVMPC
jgi:hypothetical protein